MAATVKAYPLHTYPDARLVHMKVQALGHTDSICPVYGFEVDAQPPFGTINRVVVICAVLPDTLLAVAAPSRRSPASSAKGSYMTQPLVELYGGCMVVLKVS